MEKLSQLTNDDFKMILFVIIAVLVYIVLLKYKRNLWEKQRIARRDYYRNVYLKSDAWQRKRYVVLKRDNWKCVYCGNPATQVHHTRYAKYNIG
ncbi:hypothetical protein DMZ43_06040 [Meridianimaribacter sp. CL38]|uniref:HNH endonuclease n=1 Tax=Meridianimaribacter sp. CL38 TaxID=2213021 RepID=UPI001039E31C|nr:hypothetical protein [Meridianimaribacter sp. CL38]TBV26621.1 hypothetical protein DMZ43_06040 [Meridianimaribacter sp. CL38]